MKILSVYSSLLLLNGNLSALLVMLATFVEPEQGALALLSLLSAQLSVRVLPFKDAGLAVSLNALLVGKVLAMSFGVTPSLAVLALLAGPLCHLGSLILQRYLQRELCAPFVVVGAALLSVAHALALPAAVKPEEWAVDMPLWLLGFLKSLGGIYLSFHPVSGLLVLLALARSSPRSLLLAMVGYAASTLTLQTMEVPAVSYTYVFAGTQVMLATIWTALWLTWGRSSVALSLMAGGLSWIFYLALAQLLSPLGQSPLAWPFLCSVWTIFLCLNPSEGHKSRWQFSVLPSPQLPELSQVQQTLARARGLEHGSLALTAPFHGTWEVYQGWDGPHTHRGAWRHGLDFYRRDRQLSHQSFAELGEDCSVESFLCFGAVVTSPVAGWLVQGRGDLPDNAPGEVDIEHRWGNYLMIRTACQHYVVLAHLQHDSLMVTVGQQVAVGQNLARCGNSGRSPQPHLHLHVQADDQLGSPTVPFHLTSVITEDGQFSMFCRPKVGDRLRPAAPSPTLGKALHFPVGRQLHYQVGLGPGGRSTRQERSISVELDLVGQFWFCSDSGSRVAFVEKPDFLALFARCHQRDFFLDAFTLALGVVPLCLDVEAWQDRPAATLASQASWWTGGNLQSNYDRRWDLTSQCWIISADHGPVQTWAHISEEWGPLKFGMAKGSQLLLEARLDQVGLAADFGIAGWRQKVPGPAKSDCGSWQGGTLMGAHA